MDFERFFDNSIDLICCVTPQGMIRRLNGQWNDRLGWSVEELQSRPIYDFLHPEDSVSCAEQMALATAKDETESLEHRLTCTDGSHIWVAWNVAPMGDGLLSVIARDITDLVSERQKTAEQTRFLNLATQMASIGYWEHDPIADHTEWSDTLHTIFGIEPGDPRVGPEFTRSRMHPRDRTRIRKLHDRAFKSGESFTYRTKVLRPSGEWRYIECNAHCHLTSLSGRPTSMFGVIKDITDHQRALEKVEHAGLHDPLTNLPNRTRFDDHLTQSLHHTQRDGRATSVILMDLDNFKEVNDTLGHPIGDGLLIELSKRLQSEVNDTELVARLGGDEFAIVQLVDQQPAEVDQLCKRLMKLLEEPFSVGDHHLVVNCSLGIAIAPTDGTDSETLLRNADIALYKAKSDGRGVYRFFEVSMDIRLRARRQLENELKQAIKNQEFSLYYQPVFDTETKSLRSLEALLRWNSPVRGLVPPNDFIPLAEDTGLIVPIGQWVIHQACLQATTWPTDIHVSVNISASEFKSDDLLASITSALTESNLSPTRLEIEITESALLSDGEKTLSILHKLRELGVLIVMDDFGIGYSSLSYLRSFPFDKLKLDGSFVRESSERSGDRAIVKAVSEMAKSLGIETTAEGVETQSHMDMVVNEGYGQVQGFLYSKAKPASEIHELYFSENSRASAASGNDE